MPRRSVIRPCLAAAVLLVVGSLLQASPAAAALQAPNLLSPSGAVAGGSPLFAWTRVTAATSYDVQTASDATFTTDLVVRTTVNRRYVPSTVLKPGVVWWRVRAKAGAVTSAWSTGSFTSNPTPAPQQLGPADGATLSRPSEPALLTWTPVPSAAGYTVEVDGVATAGALTTSHLVVDPSSTVHHWRVKAVYAGGAETAWSPDHTFQVGPLDPVSLVAPPDGDRLDRGPLVWAAEPGAATYDLQVSTSSDFSSLVVGASGLEVARYDPQPLTVDSYFWRVRAVDSDGQAAPWSATNAFEVGWGDRAELVSPADAAVVGDPLVMQWKQIALADGYVLQLSQDDTFPVLATLECSTVHALYVPKKVGDCWPTTPGVWFWRVRATHSLYGDAVPSEARSFTYQPESVTQLSPAPGSTVAVPTLTWAPVAGASQYKLSVVALDGGGGQVPDRTVNGTSYTPGSALTPGKTYRWSVQTFHSGGRRGPQPAPEDQPTFTVRVQDPATGDQPTPASPAQGSTFHRFPMLTWDPVAGATRYRIVANGVEFNMNFSYPAGTIHTWSNLPGDVEWWVNAYDGTTLISSGPSSTFTIAPLDLDQESLASSGETLSWDPVTEAGHYHVSVYDDAALTGHSLLPTTFVDTESTRFLLPDSLPDGTAYWQVVACVNGTSCAPVTPATHSFDVTSPQPVPQVPSDGSSGPMPSFAWQSYAGATSYRLQVATDSGFTTLLDDLTTATSACAPSRHYPDGTLFWRVSATDRSGHVSPFSDSQSFTQVTAPPGPDPSAGDLFRWNGTAYAASYAVEVLRDGVDSPVVSATTDQPALAPEAPLAPASYSWRVRALDAHGNPGAWSAPATFDVAPEPPLLGSPAPSVNQSADDSLFTWSAVPNARSYRFERRHAGASTNSEATTTAATAYATASHLADGAWEWRVVAVGLTGFDLGASPWRAFTVDTAPPVVTAARPAPGTKVRPGVRFVVTFSEPVTGVSRATVKLVRKGLTRSVRSTVRLSANRTQVTLDPAKLLLKGRRYTLKVTSGIHDLHGLAAVATSWSVTVRQ